MKIDWREDKGTDEIVVVGRIDVRQSVIIIAACHGTNHDRNHVMALF